MSADLNPGLILEKLSSLKRCISRIEQKRTGSAELLRSDLDAQEIILLNLERAVQQCVDIAAHIAVSKGLRSPMSMGDGFRSLEELGILEPQIARSMIQAVGFRNVAVHEYQSLNLDILFSIITDHLDDFRCFAASIMDSLTPGK